MKRLFMKPDSLPTTIVRTGVTHENVIFKVDNYLWYSTL